ncbi:MAG: PAS domain-containing protein [Treponema sp.]|nr:PAS domain-containing protein [Treponema sp.]
MAAIGFALLLFAAGILLSAAEYRRIQGRQFRELTAIGALKARQVEAWRADFLADALMASRSPLLRDAARRLLGDPADTRLRLECQEQLALYTEQGGYEAASLYAPAGELLAGGYGAARYVPPGRLDAEALPLARGALDSGKPRFRDIYRRPGGDVSIEVFAPVRDRAGRPLGLLVLRRNPERDLFPLVELWPVPAGSAETYLVRRKGDQIVALDRLRFDKRGPLGVRFPLGRKDLVGVQAILGARGLVRGKDYRGVRVLADVESIEGSPWLLIAKMDESEALAEASLHALAIVGGTLALALIVAAALAFAFSRREGALYRALFHEEKRRAELNAEFRATLFGIGDGVIATDAEGQVRWLNAAAQALTGWTEAEARGRPLGEVFGIFGEDDGEEVSSPVEKVLRTGAVVGLANHTILRSKDGKERPIADSGAPILGVDGSIRGVVIVFRDKSAEHEAAAKVRWLSGVIERSLNEVYIYDAGTLRFSYANRAAVANVGYGIDELLSMTPLDIKPEFTAERLNELLEPLRSGGARTATVATVHRRKDGSTYDIFLSIQLLDAGDRAGGGHFLAVGLDLSERLALERDLRRALVERETLLRELHHRTKNNLQVVCSLLSLEASDLADSEAREALGDMESRVGSIALAHELLYQSKDLAKIELGRYLTSIAALALESRDLSSRIALRVNGPEIEAPIDIASPLGLVINELATNSAKYAFPDGRSGSIDITLSAGAERRMRLEYRDDGVGLPESFDGEKDGHLGMDLIDSLVSQLGGSLSIAGAGGFACRIDFELPAAAEAAVTSLDSRS